MSQVSGGGEPGDGIIWEAAYRGPAANQEEVEGGERHQARAVLLQVRPEIHIFLSQPRSHMYTLLCLHMWLTVQTTSCSPLWAVARHGHALNYLFIYQHLSLLHSQSFNESVWQKWLEQLLRFSLTSIALTLTKHIWSKVCIYILAS